jgi:hypothetical protein
MNGNNVYSVDTTQYLFTVHIYKRNTKKRVTKQIQLHVIDLSEEFHPD